MAYIMEENNKPLEESNEEFIFTNPYKRKKPKADKKKFKRISRIKKNSKRMNRR